MRGFELSLGFLFFLAELTIISSTWAKNYGLSLRNSLCCWVFLSMFLKVVSVERALDLGAREEGDMAGGGLKK